ncbi:MAG: hypothetical protein PSV17_07835 [Methylotenera sp.]|uniref:hypothetical protein n=1 Tax=Methylotenera sp. TaxID=2051956 RepID=UPI002489F02B|nr:hypothetical protein [Methylotenera sp.]MDI1309329.1 hypothetical protein [Methylotenera sp.]
MDTIDIAMSVNDLLTPLPFKREDYTAHLYRPYSIKLHRQVNLFSHHRYDLWVLLETDTEVSKFNERVAKVPIASVNGQAFNATPSFVTLGFDKSVVIHNIINTDESESETGTNLKIEAWGKYCSNNNFKHQLWNSKKINANAIELANLKRLLRFTSFAGLEVNNDIENSILDELRNVKKTIYLKVIEYFPQSDPELIKVALSRLIINRKIFSDISLSPLSMLTEVSVYHEFSKK